MVAPLIIGAARIVAQKTAGTAVRSRAARAAKLTAEKSGGARFAKSQSLEARAAHPKRTSTVGTPQQKVLKKLTARSSRTRIPSQEEDSSQSSVKQKVMGLAVNIRFFMPLLVPLSVVSVLIALMGILGVVALAGTGALSWFVSVAVDTETIGMLFIGLSFACVILAYPAVLIYLMFIKGLQPLKLTGIPFVALMMLPVFDVVPGLNIFPWLVLWTFILCTAPNA
ncbi:hypothetical protein A3C87_02900 [Candidatus Kaiserbacteria bacterium RIFCSPHIGHO2_02_FULL_49_34]|uniref:Yip1 domain-containing protein n=1 Tax=Candidatus Kaiserbacteria bacterium RIFCSPHIGHO2_02_FULL_49_34 TaxID=1798491 RepID=A0A1F6DJG2_9BACT|nr:MAG: hypothetical protein A3C87_02900 [Candidatus Kaiserbacteria bacterium RIFCSPHIGHO2_02_FULL_49_34]